MAASLIERRCKVRIKSKISVLFYDCDACASRENVAVERTSDTGAGRRLGHFNFRDPNFCFLYVMNWMQVNAGPHYLALSLSFNGLQQRIATRSICLIPASPIRIPHRRGISEEKRTARPMPFAVSPLHLVIRLWIHIMIKEIRALWHAAEFFRRNATISCWLVVPRHYLPLNSRRSSFYLCFSLLRV